MFPGRKTAPRILATSIVALIVLARCLLPGIAIADEQPAKETVAYFFYGKGCPHCAAAEPFLEAMKKKYPSLVVKAFETWQNAENARYFVKLAEACGAQVSGVPTFFIGEDVIVGFNKRIAGVLERKIESCAAFGCPDPANKLKCGDTTYSRLSEQDTIVDLPLFGAIDTRNISLPVFTFAIAALDGFNPCAFWVLSFLLTIVIHARSRKKILLVGGIFVVTSAVIYFLFMAAWLNLFLFVGYVGITRILIAVIAIIAGLINVKDFFFFKRGISLTIPDRFKPALFDKMRKLTTQSKTSAVVAGTVVLALFANTVELLCTAGFPAIYTRILTLQHLGSITYYLYLALYNLVYVIPLALMVGFFAMTMGGRKFSEAQGRVLKIISGTLMLILGLILLIRPELLYFK
ncbi:MAG: thioredoxin family protein [Nitrospirae bacterium]|nr:thioredoxin family protein [Nitrospirota bacterium]